MEKLTIKYIVILFAIIGAGLIIAGFLLNSLLYIIFGYFLPVIIAIASLILFNEN